jgi:hypothetical protein
LRLLGQVLHPDLLNENFKRAQYAVRGELYLKGEELRKAGREIIFTNGEQLMRDGPLVQSGSCFWGSVKCVASHVPRGGLFSFCVSGHIIAQSPLSALVTLWVKRVKAMFR